MRRPAFRRTALALLLAAGPAPAADYFWDPTNISGNWVTDSEWSTPTPGNYSSSWVDGNTANFSGSGGGAGRSLSTGR